MLLAVAGAEKTEASTSERGRVAVSATKKLSARRADLRVSGIHMYRALSLVCLAHAATGWSIVPTAGQTLVARPRLVRVAPSVMMTPTTELVALAAPGAIPSALVAYGHYLSFMIGTACVTAERVTIKPAMTMEEEKLMTVVDTTYGLTALLLVYTGYLRVTQYGKGWEFYQHERVLHHEPNPDPGPRTGSQHASPSHQLRCISCEARRA